MNICMKAAQKHKMVVFRVKLHVKLYVHYVLFNEPKTNSIR